mmetsp:Transcript_52885/g.87630  ORF Transcript_52885/g.87630 Transcript_52885/m.87630 type:complete len:200 (+) Transcript_52885:74-673(+)
MATGADAEWTGSKAFPSCWMLIGRKLGAEVLCGKLKEYQTIVANISGLIAGFVFVVSNTNVEWKFDGYLDATVRTNVYGACFLLALTFALSATLWAVIIYGNINTYGPNQTMVMRYADANRMYIGMPLFLMIVAIALMLLGTTLAVDGLYGKETFWVFVGFEILSVTVLLWYFIVVQGKMNREYIEILKSMPDLQIKEQ